MFRSSNLKQGERCLFCFKGEEENGSFETLKTLFKKSHQHEETLDQLGPMFVLRVILGVPVKNLEMFLQKSGHPSTWGIAICADCKRNVIQAMRLHNQMAELRKRMHAVKKNCIKCMQSSTESSNHVQKLVRKPVRDKVRRMASSGELDGDEDGCSTLLFDTNDDWLRRIVKQEQYDDESASFIDFEEPAFPPEDSPHDDDNLNLQNLEENESESVTTKPVTARGPLLSTRAFTRTEDGKEETVEEEDPSRRSIKKRATPSRKNLSKRVRKRKSNAEDSEESTSDWEYDQEVARREERRERYRNRPPRKRNNTPSTSKQEKVKCHGCKDCFSDINMRNHFNSVHSVALIGKYIQCNQCYLAFGDLRNLEIHIEITHAAEGLFRCDKCVRLFDNQKAVTKHKGRIDRLRSCEICSASCCDLATLKQHIKYFHPEVFNPQEQERQDKIRQQTLQRNKSYKVEVICEECGKVLTTTLGYKLHMELHRNPKSNDIIKCSVCGQDFMREHALKLHQCRHHAKELNLTPIPCPTCQQLYPDNSVLSEHIRTVHERIKSCVCEQCGAEFSHESKLSRHMLRHGERTVMCSECPSSFWHQRELDVHVRRKHTPYDMRPHVCNVCDRRFSRSTLLNRHRKIHQVNSTYECKVCSHTFTQANYLYCHVKRQHGQRLRLNELEDARVLTSNTASLSTSIKGEAGAISTQTPSCSNNVDLTSQ